CIRIRPFELSSLSTHSSPTDNYTLSLHDALPILMINISVLFSKLSLRKRIKNRLSFKLLPLAACLLLLTSCDAATNHPVTDSNRSEEHTSELQSRENLVCRLLLEKKNIK